MGPCEKEDSDCLARLNECVDSLLAAMGAVNAVEGLSESDKTTFREEGARMAGAITSVLWANNGYLSDKVRQKLAKIPLSEK